MQKKKKIEPKSLKTTIRIGDFSFFAKGELGLRV